MSEWIEIGSVVKLQIQRERLSVARIDGGVGKRYDPSGLLGVDQLGLTPQGVIGRHLTIPGDPDSGGWMMDVHSKIHPDGSAFTPGRALSIGFTSHYQAMAERFGEAPLGVAGENIIVACDRMLTIGDLGGGLRLETAGYSSADTTIPAGEVFLDQPKPAAPCVPFSRFMRQARSRVAGLEISHADDSADEVAPDRDFLRKGMRGFVMRLDDLNTGTASAGPNDATTDVHIIELGASLWARAR